MATLSGAIQGTDRIEPQDFTGNPLYGEYSDDAAVQRLLHAYDS